MYAIYTNGRMNPAPTQAIGLDKHIPRYLSVNTDGRIAAEMHLSVSSIIELSIGIEPDPSPWHPVR